MIHEKYDIIVVGAGHAGSEAAAAAANLGAKTLLITIDMTKIAQMSCNPAIGGIAKGQIVREIDALGGLTAIVTDKTMIQFRMLNKSKGPAMWSPRAQSDRVKFSIEWRRQLENIDNLFMWQDLVTELIVENKTVKGVKTQLGMTFYASAVVLTNGTFLNGIIYVGRNKVNGGRVGEFASYGLTEQLVELGFEAGRMKTGTPARIDGRTIDFDKLIEQPGDADIRSFSFLPESEAVLPQRPCYITHTSPVVHSILRQGFDESPLFSGEINGIGPRYCPSIEDKIVTFANRDKHQLFVEPEGVDTVEFYLNGFSSSLPLDTQLEAIHRIPGFENAKIYRPGYAIEYDYFPPTQLSHSLETKLIENLFFAGQINGTTGYEEAAAQGLMAGINAFRKINGLDPLVLARDEAYIGVLIDDLVTKGVDEPYRMFTSRAEYRILLRQDNADERLTPVGYNIGLATKYRYDIMKQKYDIVQNIVNFLRSTSVEPEIVNPYLSSIDSPVVNQKLKIDRLVLRPEVKLRDLVKFLPRITEYTADLTQIFDEIIESVEIRIKYDNYINRERLLADKLKRLEYVKIPDDIDFEKLQSISTEGRQKLSRIKPKTIGQASRIPGVSPSDINVLLIYLGR